LTLAKTGRHTFIVWALAFVFAGAFALVSANDASAQLPSACDEYDDPTCIGPVDEVDPDDGTGNNDDGGDQGPSGIAGSGDGDGSLPFTGYPLTGLILLLLVLLAAGLAIRGGIAMRERLAREPSSL
jgi:hypothetical protein